MQFQDRFATLTSVVNDSRSDLDAALKNLSDVVGETTAFHQRHAGQDRRADPAAGQRHPEPGRPPHGPGKRPAHRAARNRQRRTTCSTRAPAPPAACSCSTTCRIRCWFICGMIGALENVTAPRNRQAVRAVPRARRCGLLNFNYLPFPFNPFLTSNPPPVHAQLHRAELTPGARGSRPRRRRPARRVRVHRADGDVPPPPGYGPPPGPPPGTTAARSRAAGTPTLQDMLLPAERPPCQRCSGSATASEGTPP